MTRTVKEIAQMLAERAEDVCAMLLPGGKKNGAEWEADSVAGGKGKSCKVRLTGSKAGLWCDFATGSESGDLLDLWALAKNIKLAEAIKEAKQWLGVAEPQYLPQKKEYSKPQRTGLARLSTPANDYLRNERKLTKETIDLYRVCESNGGTWIAFPYINPNGELLNIKHIAIERDENNKKKVKSETNCAPCLFGWQAFKGGRTVVITEGEIDAMTMTQYGFPALSVPFGAGKGSKNDWIDYEWDNLEQFETIYLCYDNDEPGQACVEEIVRRLGVHRCKSVILPHKDANECLQQGVFDDVIEECISNAKSFDPPEIRSPMEFLDKVKNYFWPDETREASVFKPRLFKGKIHFRPGELTIWTGCNSHGKSLMLGQMMLTIAMRGQKAAIASMEMKPEQTIGRMVRQFWVKAFPDKSEIERCVEWMSWKLWIYDLMGTVPTTKLLELIEFSVRRHGVSHFVIDSLMRCNVAGDDYDSQRKFLNDATSFAKKHDCHIHLVAHPRKHDEEKPIGRIAVSGSGDISNQADNVVSVWRNKAKERKEKTWSESDAIVLCDKQRESGWEGMISLDFFSAFGQYVTPEQAAYRFYESAFMDPDLFQNQQPTQDEPQI